MISVRVTSKILSGINFTCALLHLFFQLYLLNTDGELRGFILTENMVVAFIFLYFGFSVYRYMMPSYKEVIVMSILFWLSFIILVLFIRPQNTTLTMFKEYLFLPQSYYLLFFGLVSFGLSLHLYLNSNLRSDS